MFLSLYRNAGGTGDKFIIWEFAPLVRSYSYKQAIPTGIIFEICEQEMSIIFLKLSLEAFCKFCTNMHLTVKASGSIKIWGYIKDCFVM